MSTFTLPGTRLPAAPPVRPVELRASPPARELSHLGEDGSTLPFPRIDVGDTIVALAGDWHADLFAAEKVLRELGKRGIRTLYHLGDFGVWPGHDGDKFLFRVNKLATHLGITIWVTPGNHEDWDRLDALHARDSGAFPAELKSHIWVLPRGFRWSHGGRTFVSVGGAPSVDYLWRSRSTWWPTEVITPAVAESVAAAGHAEVLLVHDTPNVMSPAVGRILSSNPFGFPPEALAYAEAGRRNLDTVYEGVKPQLLAHGHYHVSDDHVSDDGCRILSLEQGRKPGNFALIDLENPDFGVDWVSGAPRRRGSSFE